MCLKKQEAEALYDSGKAITVKKLITLDKKVEKLEKEVARLSKDSTTSSKPPSSDIVKKPRAERRRDAKKRKKGGQQGHKKHERPLFTSNEFTVLEKYTLDTCPECGCGNMEYHEKAEHKIFQQIDIKEIPLDIIEHQALPCWCPGCRKYHYKSFPENIVKEGLFKTNLIAAVCYLKYKCNVSYTGIQHFLKEILGPQASVSTGFLAKIIQKTSNALELPYEELLKAVPLATVLNIDETGHKNNGKLFWTWVFRGELFALFKIDKSRGSKVLIDVLGKEFEGTIGSDYYSSYKKFMKDFNVAIQFCLAHIIRDIKYLTTLKNNQQVNKYAKKLLKEIKKMFKIIHKADTMNEKVLKEKLTQVKTKIIRIAQSNVPNVREAINMAKRFKKHGEAYFEFITTPGMDPTNNIAEQAIRFIVIYRKVSQGTRSEAGITACERIWTVIATCAIQGKSSFDFLLKSLKAYFNGLPAPSMLLPTINST